MAKKWTGEVSEDINGGVEFSEGDIVGKDDFNKIANNSIAVAKKKIYRHIITINGAESFYHFECYSSKNTPIDFSEKESFSITRMKMPNYYYDFNEKKYVNNYNVQARYDEGSGTFDIYCDFIHYQIEWDMHEIQEVDSGEEIQLEYNCSYTEEIEVFE